MKRFEFSLEQLLKVKRQLERLAELEQQRARDVVDRARVKLQGFHDQLTQISERFAAAVGSAMTPGQWAAASDMTERLGQSIRQSEGEVAAAEEKLLAASQERADVAAEVEALSTLRQQQLDQWKQEAKKKDQDRLDELGIRSWQKRDAGRAAPESP